MFRSLQLRSLESRLTPAGAYTSSVVGGILTLTGTDDIEDITILDNGVGVLVTGNSGTQIDNVNVVAFGMAINGIKIVGKGGDDVVSLDGTNPVNWSGALDIDLGDSSTLGNSFNLNAGNTIAVGSVKLKGGEGYDDVNFFGTTAVVTKDFAADFGNGGSNVSIQAGTTINGAVTVKTLAGFDQFILQGVSVGKNATFTVGDGASSLELSQTTTMNGDVALTGGAGYESIVLDGALLNGKKGLTVTGNSGGLGISTINNASTFSLGGITATSKDNDSALNVGTGANLTMPGAVNLTGITTNVQTNGNLSAKALTMLSINGANMTADIGTAAVNFTKDVKLTAKKGGTAFLVNSGSLTIGGLFTSTAGTDASVTLQTASAVNITGNMSVTSKLGQATLNQGTGSFALTGNLLVAGGTSSFLTMFPVGPSSITGTTTVTGKAQGAFLGHGGADNMTFGKAVTLTGKTFGSLQLTSSATTNINGAVKLAAPSGFLSAFALGGAVNFTEGLTGTGIGINALFFPATASTIAKDVNFKGGSSGLFFNSGPNQSFGSNVNLTGGTGTSNVVMIGSTVTGNFTVTTGAENDTINLSGVSVGGLTALKTNGGADTLTIDNEAVFTGAALIDMGVGDDNLFLGQGIGLAANAVTFTGKATINAGVGNDTMLLGVSAVAGGDAFSLVSFGAGSVVDGGANLNFFDDEDGLQLGAPTITGWTDPTP